MKYFCLIMIFIFYPLNTYPWQSFTDIQYDLDFDGDWIKEIIIKEDIGAGSNHFIQQMSIYKYDGSNLIRIFSEFTLEKWFSLKPPLNHDIVNEVEFTEPDINTGFRDIIVKSKKVIYKDSDWHEYDEKDYIHKEEDLGTKIYKWDEDLSEYSLKIDKEIE